MAVQERMNRFETAWRIHGNATQAAIEAGYASKSASSMGSQLLSRLKLRSAASEGERAAFENSRLTNESVLKVLENLLLYDPGDLYDGRGRLIPFHKLPPHARQFVTSMDQDEIVVGKGKSARVIGTTSKIRTADRLVALKMAMQHRGLFEADNSQKERNLTIQVGLVQAPPTREED